VASTYTSPALITTSSYQYLDKIDYRDNGLKFIEGVGSTNLKTSVATIGGSSPNPTNYNYEYDSKGRVTQETYNISLGDVVNNYTYFD
jgi:hypothetical protein